MASISPPSTTIAPSATSGLTTSGFTAGSPKYFRLRSGGGSISGVSGNSATYNAPGSPTVATIIAEAEFWNTAFVGGTSNSDNSVSNTASGRAIAFPQQLNVNDTKTVTVPMSWHSGSFFGWREINTGQVYRVYGSGNLTEGGSSLSTLSFSAGDQLELKRTTSGVVQIRNVTTSSSPYSYPTAIVAFGVNPDFGWGNTATYDAPILGGTWSDWETATSVITVATGTNYSLTCDNGSFALAGQDATLTYQQSGNRVLTCDAGTFTLSGQDATLTYATHIYNLVCDTGVFALNGQDANLVYGQPAPALKLFPLEISSFSARPTYRTTITPGASGREVRDANWNTAIRKYDAKSSVKNINHARELNRFFHTCKGMWKAFYIKDFVDFKYELTACALTGNGSRTEFQMRMAYQDDFGDIEYRDIKYPKRGTVEVYVNGVLRTEDTHYTIDYTENGGGKIVFATAPASSAVITQKSEFYVKCRFAVDELPSIEFFQYWISLSDEEKGLVNIETIPLIEVR